MQNVVTVFNDALERVPGEALTVAGTDKELTCFTFRDKKSGLGVVTLWDGTEIPSNASQLDTVRVTVKGSRFKEPVWLDLITGNIYAIPPEQMVVEGASVVFQNVPLYDGPGVITDKSLLDFVPAREKKETKRSPATRAKKPASAGGPKMAMHLLPGTQQPAPAVLILARKGDDSAGLAKWLNGQEVHAFVLETSQAGAPDTALREAQAALRHIRSRAAEWQVKTDAVGVLGAGTARVADADFAIVLDAEIALPVPPPDAKKRLFVGKKDAWQKPLAAWLEQHKGKVF